MLGRLQLLRHLGQLRLEPLVLALNRLLLALLVDQHRLVRLHLGLAGRDLVPAALNDLDALLRLRLLLPEPLLRAAVLLAVLLHRDLQQPLRLLQLCDAARIRPEQRLLVRHLAPQRGELNAALVEGLGHFVLLLVDAQVGALQALHLRLERRQLPARRAVLRAQLRHLRVQRVLLVAQPVVLRLHLRQPLPQRLLLAVEPLRQLRRLLPRPPVGLRQLRHARIALRHQLLLVARRQLVQRPLRHLLPVHLELAQLRHAGLQLRHLGLQPRPVL
mmetsp:Transcript_20874/g.54526  ORF Transcript_20874/g.54526 Transcript_20874/m.54526 type:complete len:274 (+) Transcript_20874:414-1235(+)